MKTKSFLFLLIIWVNYLSCEKKDGDLGSQSKGNIRGRILTEAQQPILNSKIVIGTAELSSDYDGRFTLEGLRTGMHTIEVTKEGFLTKLDEVLVRSQETTDLEIVLKKGADFLRLADSAFTLKHEGGVVQLHVQSNASWHLTSVPPDVQTLSLSGSENGTVTLTYGKNNSYIDRFDTLKLVCGNLSRNIYVKQSGITDVLSVKGRIGNQMVGRADSVIIQFSGPIRSLQVSSSWIYCVSQIQPGAQSSNHTVSFAYNCADLGGDYPFGIRFQDMEGNWHTKDISVPFYKNKLEVAGAITDFVLINNEKEAMIASIDPARLIHYSIKEDSVIKIYDLSGRIGPKRLSFDRYRLRIYIMGNRSDNVQVDADFSEPIQMLDLKTGIITKGFEIPFDPTDHPQYPLNVPYDLAITKSGKAVVFLKSPVNSGLKWKLVDINDNHRVSLYPLPMISPELHIYNSYIFTSNPSEIMFVPAYGGGYYTTLNLDTYELNLQLSRVRDRSRSLVFNPLTGAIYYDQLYTQFIVSADGTQSKSSGLGILSSRFADFSYVSGDNNRIYYNYEKWLELMDYNTGSSPFAGSILYDMRQLTSTTDGKYILSYQRSLRPSRFYVFDPMELR